MKKILLIASLLLLSNYSFSKNEITEAKLKEIDRYYAAQSPKEMLNSFVDNYSANLTKEHADKFRELMIKEIKFEKMMDDLKPIMAKHFTLDELKALANFYESEHGKSSMAKMGPYMAEFFPIIQNELRRVLEVWETKHKNEAQP